MVRTLIIVVALASTSVLASAPDFSRGAVTFGLQYGVGLWSLDKQHLASQVNLPGDTSDNASLFVDNTPSAQTASFHLGYNILGHATIEAAATATGWDLTSVDRGGGGFIVGLLHWHPMALIWLNRPRPIPIDASIFWGMGYGIIGEKRGMDGPVMQWGLDANYFIFRNIGFGIFARNVIPNFNKFYVNYDRGNSRPVPRGPGLSFWTLGAALELRLET